MPYFVYFAVEKDFNENVREVSSFFVVGAERPHLVVGRRRLRLFRFRFF